ncbi:TonB family protein [Pseudomarimonas salicorniae]|uniref:TonB family protein n=1 Tax=Pseudomarimonas salicorniae TaxID=2933270 RepID=A0ABT0GDF7_9GAMM|nr:TonB family protein [Lysobacter sp. CAU 1642]MCK7592593.1 TonB family protein [Lysobacter sp. CAU 1642]
MGAELIAFLIEGTLATSAALLAVLALRRPMARTFGAGCLPLLWALVPLAQLAVWLPAPEKQATATWQILPAMALPAAVGTSLPAAPAGPSGSLLLALAWGLGGVLALIYFMLQQRRFRRRLGRLQVLDDGVLRAESSEVGPAVLGLVRPRIILPADFTQRFSEAEQALILAHERSHLRRGDVAANAIATALRCIYWFNPLVHYAAHRLRHDHELASDAEVVQRYPHARRQYADTLLNVQLAVPGLPVGCLWQSSHPLKERILMLSTVRNSPVRRRIGTSLVVALALCSAGMAWSNQPASRQDASLSAAPAPLQHALVEVDFDGQTYAPEVKFDPATGFSMGFDEPGRSWRASFAYDPEHAQFSSAVFEFNGQPATPVDLLALSRGEQVTTTAPNADSSLRLKAKVTPVEPADAAATKGSSPVAETGPTYRRLAPPTYPEAAIAAGQEGVVLLRVLVAADGRPERIEVERATLPGVFDAAAREAVAKWTFNPATRDGLAVSAWSQVPICFSLDESSSQPACAGDSGALDAIHLRPTQPKT